MTAVGARLARGARRIGGRLRQVRLLTWLAAVLVVAVLATAVWQVTRPDPSVDLGGGDSVRVGVRDGDSVPGYAASSRAELAGLHGDQPLYALVSLTRYDDPAGLATLVGAAPGVAPVYGYGRVPIPDRQTELVRLTSTHLPGDLLSSMRAVADRKSGDADRAMTRAGTESDPQLRQLDQSDAEVERAEAAAYRAGCACVYALVVRASPAALVSLAGRPGVRIVDPAPEVTDPDRAVFVAPLPEQVDLVTPPPDGGLPPA